MSEHDHDRRLTDEQAARDRLIERDRQRWLGRWQEDAEPLEYLMQWSAWMLVAALACGAGAACTALLWWWLA